MAFTLSLGELAPNFALPATDGQTYTLDSFAQTPILVLFFTCNHCPYVINSEARQIAFYNDYKNKGVTFVAINSNSKNTCPEDDFKGMQNKVTQRGFEWPYLHDESQEIALKYGALRTPHFFVFDAQRKLRYTGRMDDRPRHPGEETTRELRDAVEDLLAGREVANPLTNPIGCNVKWEGQEKHWMPALACDLV